MTAASFSFIRAKKDVSRSVDHPRAAKPAEYAGTDRAIPHTGPKVPLRPMLSGSSRKVGLVGK
jgi:hypothetical protein